MSLFFRLNFIHLSWESFEWKKKETKAKVAGTIRNHHIYKYCMCDCWELYTQFEVKDEEKSTEKQKHQPLTSNFRFEHMNRYVLAQVFPMQSPAKHTYQTFAFVRSNLIWKAIFQIMCYICYKCTHEPPAHNTHPPKNTNCMDRYAMDRHSFWDSLIICNFFVQQQTREVKEEDAATRKKMKNYREQLLSIPKQTPTHTHRRKNFIWCNDLFSCCLLCGIKCCQTIECKVSVEYVISVGELK